MADVSRRWLLMYFFILGFDSCVSTRGVEVVTSKTGQYKVKVGSNIWLHSASTFAHADGRMWSNEDDSLRLIKVTEGLSGADELGTWTKDIFDYVLPNTAKAFMKVSIRSYTEADIVVFSQIFPYGLHNSSTGDMDSVISSFPSFQINEKPLGLLSYGGLFGKRRISTGSFSKNMTISSGLESGPLSLFNMAGETIIISTFSEFMASSLWHDIPKKCLRWGIMGKAYYVPRGFRSETILYFSPRGIRKAFLEWGRILLAVYNKSSDQSRSESSSSFLGFYTDNGGFYYHNTEPQKDYEDTVFDIMKYANKSMIPYRYLQLDDWWYFVKGGGYGATYLWEPMPSVFPRGLEFLYHELGLPIVAHNRYWSNKTPYAKQNGGRFHFIMYKDLSVPIDADFWDWLFTRAKRWGLVTYEQDFLNYQTERIFQLHSDVRMGKRWLKLMADAASKNGLTLQYCMALPRHLLQSVELSAVTQARVSSDYLVHKDQWRIGVSSILAHSLGLLPFKDNFWSASSQPGNPYNQTEKYPLLEAIVSILSAGPAASSDRIGFSNVDLISKMHRSDGLLLKPGRPAMAIDSQIHEMAFRNGSGPKGEIWTTTTDISGLRFGVIFASDLKSSHRLYPDETNLDIIEEYRIIPRKDLLMPPLEFNENMPLLVDNCTKSEPCLFYVSPQLEIANMSVIIGGEMDKFVPVSQQRILNILKDDNDLHITIDGTHDEEVTFFFYVNSKWISISCVISDNNTSTLSVIMHICR